MEPKAQQRHSTELGVCISKLLTQCQQSSWDELIGRFRDIETRFLNLAASSNLLQLETRRRIAEALVRAALLKEMPLPAVQHLFNELCQLGFTNDHHKATFTVVYANLCAASRFFNEARSVTQALVDEWQRGRLQVGQDVIALAQSALDGLPEA
jgi:hypothetical protein